MEIQFLHEGDKGEKMIISVFVKEGKFNDTVQSLVNNAPANKSYLRKISTSVTNALDFFPPNFGYYEYVGSLTRPPCTENIRWVILKEPIEAEKGQIDWLHKTLGDNARPLQALNDREVLQAKG